MSYRADKLCYNPFMKTAAKTKTKKTAQASVHEFTPAEQRAARSERIKVFEAEPYGWIARSDENQAESAAGKNHDYHLFCEPQTKRLACTCADFVYRGNAEPGFECKHVSAVLKYIARRYLALEYDPQRQQQEQQQFARVA